MSGEDEKRAGDAADLDAELESQLGEADADAGSADDWADDDFDLTPPPVGEMAPPRASADAPTDAPTIEGHEIEKVLGRGGMGVVYKAQTVALLLAFALLALAGWGVWYRYAYAWPHTAHYGNFTNRWAAPADLSLPLSAEQIAQRQFSFRATRDGRFGLVRRIEAVDGRGEPAWNESLTPWLIDLTSSTPRGRRETTIDYDYNTAGQLVRETARDAEGNFVHRALYDAMHDKPGDDPRRVMRMRFVDEQGNDTTSPLGATSVRVEHDARGRVTRVLNLDSSGHPKPQMAGDDRSASMSVCGYAYEYDGSDFPVLTRFLGADGESFVTLPHGYAQMRTQSDEHGRMTHIALLDAQGQPARRDGELLPWERIAYDEFGNRAMIEKVDPQGDPLPTDEGWWKRVREHGPRGRLAREVFHSAPNAAMAYARVVHELSYDDAEGTTTTREHLEDEAGNRVPFPGDGHDQVTQTTDKQDRLIRQRRSGYDESELGYAATVETTQWAGDRPTAVTMHFENASGEAVRTHGGYTTQTQQVRDGGRVWITYSGFDEAEYGHASVVLMVDAQGDLQGFRHLDAAGEVVGPIEVFVARVLDGGQAQRVGLQAGDVLAAVGGEPVQSALLFEPAVGEGGATLDARRDGRTLSYHVQPGPLGLVARDRVVKVKR